MYVCLEQWSGEAGVFVELREDKRTRSCLSKGSVSGVTGRGEASTQVLPVREFVLFIMGHNLSEYLGMCDFKSDLLFYFLYIYIN